jgi:uncharacterized protein YyaL (SSP411 family)
VDWYPWGDAAFEKARTENKPIFLSVGYSTCYWCHVMERECFENEQIAELMNRDFVCIKVDREERPDVDQLYMTATQVLTRQGGWPMSVWMTPDLKPFYAGTYFPPQDAYNRPGFPSLLAALADAWKNRRDEIERHANDLVDAIRQATEVGRSENASFDPTSIRPLIEMSLSDYEPRFGGFGDAPKFPRQTLLTLLLDAYLLFPDDEALRDQIKRTLTHTLDAMASGGIRDHLGGGFHRYSTDAKWLVPHFEIMLYDQAMLAPVYARASRLFDRPRYAEIARGICDFVLRQMTDENGGFFTAFDAEVDHREGLNYLWSPEQIIEVLGADDGERFNRMYGLSRGPNFADPHHSNGAPDANILFLAEDIESENSPEVVSMRTKLLEARGLRKQPLLDTKIITSWNALMIGGLAIVSRELNEPRYRDAAMRAADFLLTQHTRDDLHFIRTSRSGKKREQEAFLDDYASVCLALLELHATSRDVRWKQQAQRIARRMLARFGDATGPLYFTILDQPDMILRQQTGSDSPLPSGNALAALALDELGQTDRARSIIDGFSGMMQRYPQSMSAMLWAAMLIEQTAFDIRLDAAPALTLPSSDEVVSLRAVRIGDQKLELNVDIKDGFHLYDTSVDPALGLHATRLSVGPHLSELVDFIDYPASHRLELPYGPSVSGYTGSICISIRFSVPLPAEPVSLSLSFQACDDRACLRPTVLSASA